MTLQMKRILVVGAGRALGFEIVRRLRAQGACVIATFRTPQAITEAGLVDLGAEVTRLDLGDQQELADLIAGVDAVIFTPILTVSRVAASVLTPDQRAIFFSSNNVGIDPDDPVYSALLAAERDVMMAAPNATILRPTMIYGYPGDGNLSRLAGFLRCSPIVPIPGSGRARQQPIYYKDLAGAAIDHLADPAQAGRMRVAAGPEPVSQRDLYRAVAVAVGAKPILAPIPTSAMAAILGGLEKVGLRGPVKAAQLRRAELDKTPCGADPIHTSTSLSEGLRAMVDDMFAARAS